MLDRGARDTRRRRCRRASGRLRRLASFRWPKRRHLLLPVVWDTRPRRRLAALAAERECPSEIDRIGLVPHARRVLLRRSTHPAGTDAGDRRGRHRHRDRVVVGPRLAGGCTSHDDLAGRSSRRARRRCARRALSWPYAGGPGRAARGAGSPGCDRLLPLRLDSLGRRRLGCAQCPRGGTAFVRQHGPARKSEGRRLRRALYV